MTIKKALLALLIGLLSPSVAAQDAPINSPAKQTETSTPFIKSILPKVNGTIRTKWEYRTEVGGSRFEVRNARLDITGNALPYVSYRVEIDLSDEGEVKLKNAYAWLSLGEKFRVTAGQMRVPFTIDAHRSPHQQHFANRSFIAKQVANIRDVGVMASYKMGNETPVTMEAGIYNGAGMDRQEEWQTKVNYSAKAQIVLAKRVNFALGVQSISPQSTRMNAYNVGAYYHWKQLHIEGEYVYKTYCNQAFDDVHAMNSFVSYGLPLRGVFHKISFHTRYDMMTDHSNGKSTDEQTGELTTTDYKRHRLTNGITLHFSKAVSTELRLNFEKYFYAKHSIAKESEQDKIVLELMIRF